MAGAGRGPGSRSPRLDPAKPGALDLGFGSWPFTGSWTLCLKSISQRIRYSQSQRPTDGNIPGPGLSVFLLPMARYRLDSVLPPETDSKGQRRCYSQGSGGTASWEGPTTGQAEALSTKRIIRTSFPEGYKTGLGISMSFTPLPPHICPRRCPRRTCGIYYSFIPLVFTECLLCSWPVLGPLGKIP